MGNTCTNVNQFQHPNEYNYNNVSPFQMKYTLFKSDFTIQYPIGKGGFSYIYKVLHKKTHHIYAMKEMNKASIIKRKSIDNIRNELQVLKLIKHGMFNINIKYAFHTRESLYIITNCFTGGNLRHCIQTHYPSTHFPEQQAKFIISNILLCLEYLRLNGIVHRDIKPENLLFDNNGYLHLGDFGIARVIPFINDNDTSGTPCYMAPEAYLNKQYSKYFQVDYFSLGVICYELIFGRRPFHNLNANEIKQLLLTKNLHVNVNDLPRNGIYDNKEVLCDFINRLLKRKCTERMGFNRIEEIFEHEWLRDVDWEGMKAKRVKSPFMCENEKGNCVVVKRNESKVECIVNDYLRDIRLVDKYNKQKVFDNYYFNIDYYNDTELNDNIRKTKSVISNDYLNMKTHTHYFKHSRNDSVCCMKGENSNVLCSTSSKTSTNYY